MTNEPSRRVPKEAAATRAEIEAEIEALTDDHWVRLKHSADIYVYKLGWKADGRTGDDLMQTALIQLLEDTRRWNKNKVDFFQFLIWAMRSISSNWANTYKKDKTPVLEADLRRENKEGKTFSPLDHEHDHTPNPENQLINRQILKKIDGLFNDDDRAQMVLEAWKEGCDHAGVRELWDLSQNEYNTIVRRIRRRLITAGITPD